MFNAGFFFFFGSSWNDCWEGRSGCDCNGAAAVLRVHRITGNTAGREEGERESRVPECTVKLRLYGFFSVFWPFKTHFFNVLLASN